MPSKAIEIVDEGAVFKVNDNKPIGTVKVVLEEKELHLFSHYKMRIRPVSETHLVIQLEE